MNDKQISAYYYWDEIANLLELTIATTEMLTAWVSVTKRGGNVIIALGWDLKPGDNVYTVKGLLKAENGLYELKVITQPVSGNHQESLKVLLQATIEKSM